MQGCSSNQPSSWDAQAVVGAKDKIQRNPKEKSVEAKSKADVHHSMFYAGKQMEAVEQATYTYKKHLLASLVFICLTFLNLGTPLKSYAFISISRCLALPSNCVRSGTPPSVTYLLSKIPYHEQLNHLEIKSVTSA
jgi:hypothetical protein